MSNAIAKGEIKLTKSLIRWEVDPVMRGRRRVRVRVSFPRSPAPHVEGDWTITARLADQLGGALWTECVIEMAKDAVRAAALRRAG